MKHVFLLLNFIFILTFSMMGQAKKQKIVFDVSGRDTSSHSLVLRQISNVLKAAPETMIEVVFHGDAVFALVKDKTNFREKIDALVHDNHVVFAACNNSLLRLHVNPAELLSSATVVPVAILELAGKQQEGWSYIKIVN